MARTVSEIQEQIQDNLVANFAGIGITIDITQWSKRNILRLLCFTTATAIGILEQLMDVFKLEIETLVNSAAAASQLWVQRKMFEFQYSATDPQVIALIDGAPQYPVVNENLRIITACSVKSDLSNNVKIKVAKSSPFVALSSLEIDAAQSYIIIIGAAGITYVVSSSDADEIFIEADIYYKGEYAPVISNIVITAVNAFLQNLSINNFDGGIQVSDIEGIIRAATGVTDVLLKNVSVRATSQSFGTGTDLVLDQTTIIRKFDLSAGYAIQESTAGETFADTLTFIAQ